MALIPRYAGVGETCPPWQIQVLSGGNLSSAGTLYFSFQLQNRAGFNKPSASAAIAYSINQRIVITIPESVRKDAWDIHYFVLSAGTTADASQHVQIARVPGYQYGLGIEPQSVKTVLPATIELSRDVHLALASSIATLADFPVGANRLDGQVRWVTSESKWFEYRADSILPITTDAIEADVGRWVRIGGASAYVTGTAIGVGSDRPIGAINPVTIIPTPTYPGQDAGNNKVLPAWEAQYWLYNSGPDVLPAGHEFGVELSYNEKRSPDLLNGVVMVKFIGFASADGTIRTTDAQGRNFPNTGAYFSWTPKITTVFVTADDLQVGEAIALVVKPFFSKAELNNQLTPGSTLGVIPAIRTQSGDFNPLGKLFPTGAVYAIGDRYRVVPNTGLSVDILSGSAIVGSYDFPEKPRRTVGGLDPATAGQKIVINGNGAVFVDSPAYTPSASEALRAIVSTSAGESTVGEWSNELAVSSGGLSVTLNYPSAIRDNYPDVVAGSNKGTFNPPLATIYVQRTDTGEIRSFSGFGVVVGGNSQIFTVNDWNSGSVVASLPSAAADFSLFAPGGVAIASSIAGNFPAATYKACYAFVYDGNQVTSISHASPPCIAEINGDFSPPSISVGSVTALPSGSSPTVTNSGSGSQAIFNFGFSPGEGAGGASFSGEIVCSGTCVIAGTGKAFKFYAPQPNLEITVQVSFDMTVSTGANSIQLHRWSQEPNTNLSGREFVAEMSQAGGKATVIIDSIYRWISFFAKNPSLGDNFDGCCFTVEGNTFTLMSF
ncbi:hypothetical protein WA1_18820 [Scytonema hofmannii PCC 7110]|uniref:Uncharacterized protein n=1 Tax=Scytonema hofmannii PCC 7110 TaxID=128403 RepID=A0A139XBM9_9CYAN|nr:hypothetical protein [Scytonema hofmannii]KYC42056.1 hypothetical protein WA1_18820 [Scytonema hofmannii PCC 7110]